MKILQMYDTHKNPKTDPIWHITLFLPTDDL